MDIGTAIGKPFTNVKNLVIALVLNIIPLVNIITIPGYMIRIANRTMNKDNSMPGFENFGELIIDSIKYLVMSIVYSIPAIIVLVLTFGTVAISALNAAAIGDEQAVSQAVLTALTGAVGLVVLGVILAILAAILTLSGVMNYAKTKDFGKAFAVVENLKNFFTGNFIVALIVAIVLGIVGAIIMGLLAAIPIIGIILGIIVVFAINVANMSILAEGYPQGAPVQAPKAEQIA